MNRLFSFLHVALFLVGSTAFAQDDIEITIANDEVVVLHADNSWTFNEVRYVIDDDEIPLFLRQGIRVKKKYILEAVEMFRQGWRFQMPRPKGGKSRWGNYDPGTEWWEGYWYNAYDEKMLSSRKPRRNKKTGEYIGDGRNLKESWRTGGSPGYPTIHEWLLSDNGGIKPYGT